MKTVFFDIDTQIDFMTPAGALSVPGAGKLIPSIAALNQYAWANGITVVSTMDAHAENDPEFRVWPAHCVKGTLGQAKPEQTLHRARVLVPNAPVAIEAGAPQYLLEKQALDCFTNVNLLVLLGKLHADRYVVYGVVTEYCVSCAVMGLLKTGGQVELAADAVQSLAAEDGQRAVEIFLAAGGRLTELAAVCR
jgi:nicotinamidase/pyrazinamidase